MRRFACIGLLSLGAAACTQLPGAVRLDVDGRTIEVRQRGFSDELVGEGWFQDRACEVPASADEIERIAAGAAVRMVGPREIELTGPEGNVIRLYRCSR